WDITLPENAEVGVERIGQHFLGEPFDAKTGVPPVIIVRLVVLKGEARVQTDEFRTQPLSGHGVLGGAAVLVWDNIGRGADMESLKPDEAQLWSRTLPKGSATQAMVEALKRLDKNFGSKTLNLAASEAAGEQSPESRFLGVYCLGAIDNLPKVVEALGDSKDNRLEKCNAAYDVLKCWIG